MKTATLPVGVTMTSTTSNSPLLPNSPQQYQKEQDQKEILMELNNVAVSMLERGMRKEAVLTFQEALKVLKSTNDESPDIALDRAGKRNDNNTSTDDCVTSRCSEDELIVLSSQHNPADAYKLAMEHPDASICLRMEADMDVHLVKAMLVYNYGVTHCCVAGHNTDNPRMASLGTLCFQIYQYAETLSSASDSTEFLLLSLVLTRKLEALSGKLGLDINEHYQESLATIVSALTQL